MTRQTLPNDYERMVPEFHKDTLTYAEHLTRYLSAQNLTENKVVLDIACGSGYGTQLLAKKAKKVYGIDINKTSIEYAKQNYNAANIEYKTGDGESISLKDNSVDVIVTFETIEHISDYKKFIKELKRILKPDGLLVVSTPNDLEFAEGNHFHLHEFQYEELITLLKKDFKNIEPYYQATWKYVAVGPDTIMQNEGKLDIPTLNLSPISPDKYLYFYLLCSNRKITETIEPLGAIGEHYSDRKLIMQQDMTDSLKNDYQVAQEKIAQLEQVLQYQKNETIQLAQEIHQIKNSKAYNYIERARSVKNKIYKPKA